MIDLNRICSRVQSNEGNAFWMWEKKKRKRKEILKT